MTKLNFLQMYKYIEAWFLFHTLCPQIFVAHDSPVGCYTECDQQCFMRQVIITTFVHTFIQINNYTGNMYTGANNGVMALVQNRVRNAIEWYSLHC